LKICMITHNYIRYEGDNVAPFIKYITDNLRKLNNDVTVLAAYDEKFDKAFQRVEKIFVFKYAFPSRFHIQYGNALVGDKKLNIRGIVFGPFYLISGFLRLLLLHEKYRFDILNAHWVIPNGIIGALASRVLKVPLVISLHGSGIYLSKKNRIFRALAAFVFRSSEGITACSPVLRDEAVELGASLEKSEVIPYGVDLSTFTMDKNKAEPLREELGIAKDDLVVLALGRMVEKKGFEYLLKAIPEIVSTVPRCKFIFAGNGPVLKELKLRSKKLKIGKFVLFPGDIIWKDVPLYHSICDVFVVPSVYDSQGNVDGLPNVILESMATGKPIVASNIAGIPLAVKEGRNGLLVEEKNVNDIEKAVLRLLQSKDLRNKMGKESRRMVENSLNWFETAKQFYDVYLQAIEYNSNSKS